MEYLAGSVTQLLQKYIRQKRSREQEPQIKKRQKIHIVRSPSLTTTQFYFPGSNDSQKTLNSFSDPALSVPEAQQKLQLLTDTIIYTQKKLRKLDPGSVQVPIYESPAPKQKKSKKKSVLCPGQALSVASIEKYFKLVPFPNAMSFVSVAVYKTISDYYFSEANEQRYRKNLQDSGLSSLLDNSFVLIPVQEAGWSLICVNNECKVLEFYSSDPEQDYQIACQKVEKVLSELEKAENYDWDIMRTPEHECLSDSGVVMLTIVKELALNKPFSFTKSNSEYFRTQIAIELKENTLL
jgi:hypothetical protein